MVGVINTLVDFGIYLILRHNGLHLVAANIISTTTALVLGMALHHSFTFRQADHLSYKQAALFAAVTLSGLWIIQPIVMLAVGSLDTYVQYVHALTIFTKQTEIIANIVPKIFATAVTLVWNFVLYDKVVFTGQQKA